MTSKVTCSHIRMYYYNISVGLYVYTLLQYHSIIVSTYVILFLGKSLRIQECLKTHSGEESSSSGCFNPVYHLQQAGCLGRVRASRQDTSGLVTSTPQMNRGVHADPQG